MARPITAIDVERGVGEAKLLHLRRRRVVRVAVEVVDRDLIPGGAALEHQGVATALERDLGGGHVGELDHIGQIAGARRTR